MSTQSTTSCKLCSPEKPFRLSKDEATGTVVALATPETQREIAATVAQLKTAEAEFEAIELKKVDPYYAITLIEQMLDLPNPLDEPEQGDEDRPKIDADPASMRLFVRAKRYEIEQIKKIVEGLESGGGTAPTKRHADFSADG